MNMSICSSTDAELEACCRKISDRISDLWFDINQIHTDMLNSSVTIPMSASKTDRCNLRLICTGVTCVDIEDPEQVVNYDVRKLRYIRRKHQIELWGNIPIRISLKLKMQWKLCLEAVSETGNQ